MMKLLITGGRSDIAFALAQRQVEAGNTVTVTSSTPATTEECRKRYKAAGLSVKVVTLNLADPDDSASVEGKKVLESGIDALILNSWTRVPELKLFHEFTLKEIESEIEANVRGNLWVLRHTLPKMIEKSFGRIIFVSSVSVVGTSKYGLYGMGKSAIEGMIMNLAVDYGKYNILSNVVRPGIVKTERNQAFWEREGYVARVTKIIPRKELGEPDQIAEAFDPLLSKRSYINGSIVTVSGGLPLIST